MIELDLQFLAFLAGTVIPVAVALVTARVASSRIKGALNALLALVAGLVVTAQQADGVISKTGAVVVFYTWVASVATHYGLLKPTGLTGSNGLIQRNIPQGVGGASTPRVRGF